MQTGGDDITTPDRGTGLRTYLTAKEAAEVLRKSPNTLKNWRHQEIGPRFYKLGYREVVYTPEDIEAFIQQSAVG